MNRDILPAVAIVAILLAIGGVVRLANMANNTIEKKEVVKTKLPITGCVIVAEVNDCKIYNCSYKMPNHDDITMVKELVVCQTSDACMTVVDRRHPP